MRITPEIQDIKNAYMIARSDNNTSEMNRLKAKAMALMNNSSEHTKVDNMVVKKYGDSNITENEDGDLLVLSSPQNKKVPKKLL